MNEKRIVEEIGVMKLFLTIAFALFAPFVVWLYHHFIPSITYYMLFMLGINMLIVIVVLIINLFILLKKL
jgi:hypothetical protein